MARERSGVFGEAVTQYESARPGYPDELIGDVLNFAGAVERALEIGAGTGKATVPLAERGLDVTCLEPDHRMAAELVRKTSQYPLASVVEASFESWESNERFDLLVAAQSWHWMDNERKWDLAHGALKERATLAIFWNIYALTDEAMQIALLDIDRHYHVDVMGYRPSERPFSDFLGEIEVVEGWPGYEILHDPRFNNSVSKRFHWERIYSTSLYLDFLSSLSAYRMIEESERFALLRDVASLIDRRGGAVSVGIASDLFMCRTL